MLFEIRPAARALARRPEADPDGWNCSSRPRSTAPRQEPILRPDQDPSIGQILLMSKEGAAPVLDDRRQHLRLWPSGHQAARSTAGVLATLEFLAASA